MRQSIKQPVVNMPYIMNILSSLSNDDKFRVIENLLKDLQQTTKNKKHNDMSFVKELSGSWEDDKTTEEIMHELRDGRELLSRDVEVW